MTKNNYVFSVLFILFSLSLNSQSIVADMIQEKGADFETIDVSSPFVKSDVRKIDNIIDNSVLERKTLLNLDNSFNMKILKGQADLLKLSIPVEGREDFNLKLTKIQITTNDFKLYESSDRQKALNFTSGSYYWGVIEGMENSLVAINVFKDEISGMISTGKETYTLAKIKDSEFHLVYLEEDVKDLPMYECFTDDIDYKIGEFEAVDRSMMDANNCVQMYVEVDNDLYNTFGTTAATSNYVLGAFSQVAIMYANESINFTVNELVVWNTTDPYTGPSTSNYLNQFRSELNGNYNGDLAHLVGNSGGGGIAYVDVLCSGLNGVAYSAINNTYNNIPTYSWTVNVLTHEIGHNLGSPHTHNCSWSGGAIDGCGPQAGYSEGCDGPIPNSGTVMSYCHLLSSVGIDPVNGFGPQPGDLIRANVYNATCLTTCSTCPEFGDSCDDGDACTTGDAIDSNCNCAGTYTDNDNDGFCVGDDVDDNDPCVPVECPDCTDVTVSITLDNYPGETTWDIKDGSGNVIASGGPYGSSPNGSTVSSQVCLVDACFDFTIYDSYGDGICCAYGSGSYSVSDANNTYASGGAFGSSETTNFCISGDPGCTLTGQPCNDNDGCTLGETYDADCNCNGGVYTDADGDGYCVGDDADDTDPCVPDASGCGGCDWFVLEDNTFESGWGMWNDGGSDCRRSSQDAAYANSGSYCVRIRDNTSTSTTTTDNLNLAAYDQAFISFTYYPRSMDNASEDFWFQVSTNGGATYTTVEEWNLGDEFQNNVREFDDFYIDGPFTANTRFRFRCDASANPDYIYLDDIVLWGYTCGAGLPQGNEEGTQTTATEITVYPNPVSKSEELRIEATGNDEILSIEVYNLTGQLLFTQDWDSEKRVTDISLEGMQTGSYFLSLQTDQGVISKKFIVIE